MTTHVYANSTDAVMVLDKNNQELGGINRKADVTDDQDSK